MKRFLLLLLSATSCFGQIINNGPVEGVTAISPITINYSAQGVIDANGFITQQGITDPVVSSDLAGFCAELRKVGISPINSNPSLTNLVDCLFLQPRFLLNGTNGAKSWTGQTITTSNITFSPWAAAFNKRGLITAPLPQDCQTNTFVIVYREYLTNFDVAVQQWVGGLRNSDPTKYTGEWYYNDNTSARMFIRETNTYTLDYICPWRTQKYDFDTFHQYVDQRVILGISSTGIGGGGIYNFWVNGTPAKFGNSVTNFYYTNIAIVPNFPLNQVQLGVDNLGPAAGFFGGYFNGEISWFGVFNAPVTTNQMAGIYRALRYLEPETVNRVWWGDSQFALNFNVNSNATPNYFQNSGAHTNEVCWKSLCETSQRFVNFYSLINSNQLYLDAPYGKVTRTEHYIQGGINDIYGDGDSVATVSNGLFGITDMDMGMNIRPYVFTVMPIATNTSSAFPYTAAKEVIVDGLNLTIITNAYRFAGVIRLDLLQGQTDLDTNLNTFSSDGLHLFGPTGFIMNRRIADLALGTEFAPIGNMLTVGNYPYTLKIGDYLVRCTTASGSVTLKLPASSQDAEIHIIKKTSSDANIITIDGNGKNIDGSSTTTISVLNASKTFTYDQSTGTWNVN
jgi:hypothetical protein